MINAPLLSASWACLFFLSGAMALEGGLIEQLKPVLDKQGDHSIRNIDFIYMINLDERPKKCARALDELAPYGIVPCRFSAINGWAIPLEELGTLGVAYEPRLRGMRATYYPLDRGGRPCHGLMNTPGRRYFRFKTTPGEIGCALSHLSVLQDAYDAGHKTIWVTEDDIVALQNPHLLSDRVEALDALLGEEGWDVLFTDQEWRFPSGEPLYLEEAISRPDFASDDYGRFAERSAIDETFRWTGVRYGSYSMILRRSGIEKLLDFFKAHNIFMAYDLEMVLPHGLRMVTLLDDVVSNQLQAPSDTRSRGYDF